ncbi:protein SUPPRESSOR OF npr1-1, CONSTITUTIVE [Salix suchowensis]|nr:protein SUPPRESSOR OF npr1-1, CONSTITUTIVE [Salix suchowensis]
MQNYPASSSPPTLTNAQTQVKFDVFLSFRGEDTRAGFTSHLCAALNRKQILTFMDYQLVRGDGISASLLRTIEEAKLSVVVFSEKYASSKWCLEELAKIFECRKNNGQKVIPVFYQVDPSHVRNQTGSFGDVFARLVRKKPLTMDKVQSFRDALTDAANLAGWSLGKSDQTESEFIEKIVGDVLSKLHAMSSSHTTGLFGIDVRVNKVESLLNMESQDVLIVGIWGMGGVGKTTIAEAVCSKVRSRFEGIFVANFRQELKTGSMADLQRSFLSQLLGQEILSMGSLSFRDTFVRDRLRRKKVFIVLDDVDDLMPLEEWKELLHGRHRSFGPGSKVLMTSRDKQVLNNVVDETYEVERLSYEEALQLFSSKALKNCISTIHHRDFIGMIASHVQGNPLALIVLGSSLYGKSTEEWYSALSKLAQNPRIENALQIHLKPDAFAMMDSLRFLKFDFDHFSEDNKDKILLPPIGLTYLSNKLVYFHWDGFPSISLPQNFCAEHLVELNLSYSKVEKLWTGVQAKNLVCFNLVGCVRLTEVPSSLQHLEKLEELDIRFCNNLRSFPMLDSKVLRVLAISRCLDIIKCPTISQNMKRLELWETSLKGVPQSVTSKLEHLSLRGCSKITKFPEISGDIKELYLGWTAITKVPSSIQFLKKLSSLSFGVKHMISLGTLLLRGTLIKELPLSIKDMVCLRHLRLDGTPIKTLPELPPSLTSLTASDCESLETTMISTITLGGIGSSLTIQLPSNCHQLKGIAFCLVFLLPLLSHDMLYEFDFFRIYLKCHVESKNGDDPLRKYSGKEVTFKFYNIMSNGKGHVIRKPCKLKSCGVYLHFDENIRADDTLFVNNNKQKLKRKLSER